MCLRNYHYERSANMTEQQQKEREKEGEKGERGNGTVGFCFCWNCFCTLLAFTQRGQEMSKWQTVDLVSRKCQSCARFRVAAFGTRLNFELWAMDTRLPACLPARLPDSAWKSLLLLSLVLLNSLRFLCRYAELTPLLASLSLFIFFLLNLLSGCLTHFD